MEVDVFLCSRQLFIGHINAHDLAMLSDHLRKKVNIATRPASQIKHAGTFEDWRINQPAAIKCIQNFRVDFRQIAT